MPPDHPRAQRIASSGHPFPSVELRIVDPETCVALPDGQIGELWVSSDSVARGYVGDLEATRATFDNRLAGEGDRPWLRTGDLGALLDGELYVTGRRKELIIVRGRNIHPHDVESAVRAAALPALRPGGIAAIGVELDGAEQLALVVELRGAPGDLDALAADVRLIVAAEELHLAQLVIVDKAAIPKTTSGKLRRTELARRLTDGRLAADPRTLYLKTWSPPSVEGATAIDLDAALDDLSDLGARPPAERRQAVRAALTAAIAALTGEGLAADDGDVGLNELGLDSLAIASLVETLERTTGRATSRVELFELTTLNDLVGWAVDALAAPSDAITLTTTVPAEPVRATPFQALVHIDQGAAPGFAHLIEIDGPLTPAHTEATLRALLARHDLLRARFEARDGALWMSDTAAEPVVTVLDAQPRDAQLPRVDALLRAPFDIGAPPLLRAIHAPLLGGGALLGLAASHLIYDAISLAALLDECLQALGDAASGAPLDTQPTPSYLALTAQAPEPPSDHVEWWREHLAAAPWPVPVPHPEADAERWMILAGDADFDAADTAALRALARRCGTTLDAVVATAWAHAMGACLDIDTVTCAHPISARTGQTRDVCGPLLGDVVLPLPASPGVPDTRAVERTAALFRASMPRADVPYPTLAALLPGPTPPGGCPVLYAYYDWDYLAPQPTARRLRAGMSVQLGPLNLRTIPIAPVTGPRPFDYFAAAEHDAGALRCSLRVNRDRVGTRVGGEIVERWRLALRALIREASS